MSAFPHDESPAEMAAFTARCEAADFHGIDDPLDVTDAHLQAYYDFCDAEHMEEMRTWAASYYGVTAESLSERDVRRFMGLTGAVAR